MSISYLSIQGVRNLENVYLDFHERYNFFIGANGSGKTSLLEAIYLLGTARSFRTHLYRKVVNHDKESLTVFGHIQHQDTQIQMGVQKQKDGETLIKIDQSPCRQSAILAQHLPLQLYYPDSFKIIDSSPKIRREILDWGVFHVKQSYFKFWAQYQRTLKQRNAWLRGTDEFGNSLKWNDRNAPCPWDNLLSDYADKIHQMRVEYFELFTPIFNHITTDFFGSPLEITYNKGWGHVDDLSDILFEYLIKDKDRDHKMGYTHHGPHKADILIHHNGKQVKDYFSRGQQKLVIIAIKLAQGILLSEVTTKECVYLLDDICAEFDSNYLHLVMLYLSKIKGQIFFTGVNEIIFRSMSFFEGQSEMFHVKQGNVISTSETVD